MTDKNATGLHALQGLKVVECATIIAAPLCGRLMADFGAEVIHVEPPGKGDPLRKFGFTTEDGINPWFKHYARNKKTVTLNISQPQGRDILFRLLADADIFIENFRPGRLEEWGINYEDLAKINPGLIMVRLTGFGQYGPYSSQPGFGTLMEAMSGFADMTGFPDGPPVLPTFALADSFAGFYAASAAMFAIYNRDIVGSGKGQVIDVSILEALYSMLGPNAMVHQLTGQVPERTGNRNNTSAPRNVYRTADDRWVTIAGSTQSTATRLFDCMGRPELIDDPRYADNSKRVANNETLDVLVADWVAGQSLDAVITLLREKEVPVAPIFNVADLTDDPHAQAREMIIDSPDGKGKPLKMEGIFPKLSGTPGEVRHAGREMGADNDEIFNGLGLSVDEMDALRRDGII
jgi:crotonobetainyl-CoA:carnitine CoA-transferase CaiB-like acyl-CoA transferase